LNPFYALFVEILDALTKSITPSVPVRVLLARSVNHGWVGLQSFDDPVDAPPFAAFPDQRFKPFAFLAAQPHTVSGLALDAKIRAWIVEPGLAQQTAID